jgi:hypothetical protein
VTTRGTTRGVSDSSETLKTANPQTVSEQTAYDKWLDRTADREQARQDRIHGAVGVIPGPLSAVLFFIAAIILAFMLLFADSAERWYAQAMLMGSVVAVITAMLLLIRVLDQPIQAGFGGVRPVAMERALRILDQERQVAGDYTLLPCDANGVATQ